MWEKELLKEDPSNAITSVDPNEAEALGVPSGSEGKEEATVLIPNRSRNQYIRQVGYRHATGCAECSSFYEPTGCVGAAACPNRIV